MVSDTLKGPVENRKQSLERRRLLVVGEDLGELTACRAFFEKFSFQVVASSTHAQAVRSLQSEGFHFVLLNQGSPRLDWRGVLAQAIAIDRHAPVLVVTRCVDIPSYLDAMHLGAIDYVEEPATRTELVRLIEGYLQPQAQASEPRKEHD
jgi:DNA-binding NtrC family response regulator